MTRGAISIPSSFKLQLLKWVGSKQRFAGEIAAYFPNHFGRYFEPFPGSGAVLAMLAPASALGSDIRPLQYRFVDFIPVIVALHQTCQNDCLRMSPD